MQENSQLHLFFATLQTKDASQRRNYLDEIEKEFDDADPVNDNNNLQNGNHANSKSSFYPVLLRLAHECPFKDVRQSCEKILKYLENQGVRIPRRRLVGPSAFIPENECVAVDTDDVEKQSLFADAFIMNGRLSHIHQILGYHVKYLSQFLSFESKLLHQNGPLQQSWIYYIGIIGAARHQCSLLVEECERKFMLCDGDPDWLDSIENIPNKLKKLFTLNKLLAHQPWLINVDVLKDFFTGPAEETWSMSELLHAILVLLHFQTLSGFIFGCGINPEIDSRKGHTKRSPSSGEYTSGGSEPITPTKIGRVKAGSFVDDSSTQQLFEKMLKVQEEYELSSQDGEDDGTDDEKLRQFKEVAETNQHEMEEFDTPQNRFNQYLDDKQFHYKEYAKREKKDTEVFRAHDYNWQEHCFAFVNRLYPNIGPYLDGKFNCSFDLTYNSMGGNYTDVDTSKFRLATWNYIHLIYGIFHDDYLYVEVNKLLEKPYKSYIKKVACFPERITFLDYWEFYSDFLPSEKVHINLLVLESRFQAALLYVSRALMKHMDNKN
ncbi:sestrin-1-like isoform X2 [Clytia hemisphaerica]|uniref:Sestrin n=1 Tax=Clytia hemisphaerica TaxID=252671 RepID=A0A7M5WRW8_9CNID